MAQPQILCFVPALHNVLSQATADVSTPSRSTSSLSTRTIASDAASIKLNVQKARAAVGLISAIDQTIEEQEVEIAELESSVRELRSVKTGFALFEEQSKHEP